MKDIYEILNDIEIDEDEMEIIDATDIEKAKVKKVFKEVYK